MCLWNKRATYAAKQSLPASQPDPEITRITATHITRIAVIFTFSAALVWILPDTRVLAKAGQVAEQNDAIDPDAVEAITKMSAYLRTLKSFQVLSDSTNDDVLDDGQVVQTTTKVDLLAAKPDRLRVEVTSDDRHRLFLYDGKTFTVWGRLVNYYASVPAPPSIAKLIDVAAEKYGIDLPLIDLFTWGSKDDDVKKIQSAADIGPSTVDGVTCEHYTFHQEHVDWQIWIQLGEFPLPRKLVIRTLTDEARPQHSDTLTWNLAPSFNNEAFVFNPPPDAKRIVLAEEQNDSTRKEQ